MASETPPEKERTKGRKQIVKTNDGQVKHTSSNSREKKKKKKKKKNNNNNNNNNNN